MDLWTEASRDVEADELALRMAQSKVAVAGLWPFLALAQSGQEFDHRLALASDHIANAVPVDLLHPIVASLREDYAAITAAKDAEGKDEADDEDGDGKPDWLQDKIKSKKESAMVYHAGLGRWVAWSGYAGDPEPDPGDAPTDDIAREEWERERARTDRPETEDDDPIEAASWRDLGQRGPSHASRKPVEMWHAGLGRWVAEVHSPPEGGGNPYYFTGGPEAGPNTGQTNQFPPHPTGHDPVDPLNEMFPMQPSPWAVPPGGEWKESPMNFNPPTQRTGGIGEGWCKGSVTGRHTSTYHQGGVCSNCGWKKGGVDLSNPEEAEASRRGTDAYVDRANRAPRGHYGSGSSERPERHHFPDGHDGEADYWEAVVAHDSQHERAQYAKPSWWGSEPDGQRAKRWDEANNRYASRLPFAQAVEVGERDKCSNCNLPVKSVKVSWGTGTDWTHTGEHGFEADDHHMPVPSRYTRTAAGNPYYFSGGHEGVEGDGGDAFPEDPQGVEPVENRINELYGPAPISGGFNDDGSRVAFRHHALTPDNPAPDSDPLQGTEFASPQEAERWRKAQNGEQQDSRGSSTFGSRRPQFYDPSDSGVRVVAEANPFSSGGNPFTPGEGGAPEQPMGMGMGTTPATTPPRTMPGAPGGGGDAFGQGVPTDTSDQAAKQTGGGDVLAFRRFAEGGQSRDLASDDDPTGLGDEYRERTIDGPLKTRPRQPAEHRDINTPQRPQQAIPTIGSPSEGPANEEEGRREAARVAARAIRELVGA